MSALLSRRGLASAVQSDGRYVRIVSRGLVSRAERATASEINCHAESRLAAPAIDNDVPVQETTNPRRLSVSEFICHIRNPPIASLRS